MTTPDLEELNREVDRRRGTSRGIDLVPTGTQLGTELQGASGYLVEHLVAFCRQVGRSWGEIGEALGVTRQAAQQRFAARVEQVPDVMSAELERAFAATMREATEHGHRYVGTEHLLLGILSERNRANVVLEAIGVNPAGLRHAVEGRLGPGVSRAARRIPWSPYARRVLYLTVEYVHKRRWTEARTEDLLVGLVRVGQGIAAEVLRGAGADYDTLHSAITRPTPEHIRLMQDRRPKPDSRGRL